MMTSSEREGKPSASPQESNTMAAMIPQSSQAEESSTVSPTSSPKSPEVSNESGIEETAALQTLSIDKSTTSAAQNLAAQSLTTQSQPSMSKSNEPPEQRRPAPTILLANNKMHTLTEIILPNRSAFSYGFHLLSISERKPLTSSIVILAKLLEMHLHTTVRPKPGVKLVVALQHLPQGHKVWIPFTEAEAKYICYHMDYLLWILESQPKPCDKDGNGNSREMKEEFKAARESLLQAWGSKFLDALQENVEKFEKRSLEVVSNFLKRNNQDLANFPALLRIVLEIKVSPRSPNSASPLHRRLLNLLTSQRPELDEGHLLYLATLFEMVEPTGLLDATLPRPPRDVSEGFVSFFGVLGVEFLEAFLEEGMPLVVQRAEKKVVLAKRDVKKWKAKLEGAVEKQRLTEDEVDKKRAALSLAKEALMEVEREDDNWFRVLKELVETFKQSGEVSKSEQGRSVEQENEREQRFEGYIQEGDDSIFKMTE